MCRNFADYGTHAPILAAAVALTSGPVIELGVGHYSTSMLHYMCRGRLLVSMDTDLEWLKQFTAYACPRRHEFVHVKQWNLDASVIEAAEWSVALVDGAPGEERPALVDRLRRRCRWIVCHDTELDYGTGANYGYEAIFSGFKYRTDFRRYRPYTTVVSDQEPFPVEPCDRTWVPTV